MLFSIRWLLENVVYQEGFDNLYDWFIARYDEYKSVAAMARKYGWAPATFRRIARMLGIQLKHGGARPHAWIYEREGLSEKELVEWLNKFHDETSARRALIKRFGMSKPTAYRYVRRFYRK